jgi:1-acyl-sn-glycerol-3-phosphate acyltransferase
MSPALARPAPLTSAVKLSLYLAFTALLLPVQAIALAIGAPLSRRLPLFYHRWCVRLLGFKLEISGEMSTAHPTLFACNHASYLDITMLGAVIPGSFIAKSEVAGWPLFGTLAKLQRTVFIQRKRTEAAGQRDGIKERLKAGDSLILFPEGTSSDGNRTLPFKSALFSVADLEVNGGKLIVQPVSIAYTKLDGIAIGRALRPFFAWYGDMDLAPHLWRVLGLGTATVDIRFHPPRTMSDLGSRKALADYCHTAVAHGVADAISGRPSATIAPAPSAEGEAANG